MAGPEEKEAAPDKEAAEKEKKPSADERARIALLGAIASRAAKDADADALLKLAKAYSYLADGFDGYA